MKDLSKIVLLALLVLLIVVLSTFHVSTGAFHMGGFRRLLPLLAIGWLIWMFSRGGCCCRRRSPAPDDETAEPDDAAEPDA
ncbi:hypothetical protein [Rhodocaloribacter sp.]